MMKAMKRPASEACDHACDQHSPPATVMEGPRRRRRTNQYTRGVDAPRGATRMGTPWVPSVPAAPMRETVFCYATKPHELKWVDA